MPSTFLPPPPASSFLSLVLILCGPVCVILSSPHHSCLLNIWLSKVASDSTLILPPHPHILSHSPQAFAPSFLPESLPIICSFLLLIISPFLPFPLCSFLFHSLPVSLPLYPISNPLESSPFHLLYAYRCLPTLFLAVVFQSTSLPTSLHLSYPFLTLAVSHYIFLSSFFTSISLLFPSIFVSNICL